MVCFALSLSVRKDIGQGKNCEDMVQEKAKVHGGGVRTTVTVLVPIYGVEKYIGECVESLMKQTYPEIRYVFCNDCTKDRSIEVLRQTVMLFPKRMTDVRIIENSANKGLGATRKRLLAEVDTDAFVIVDSDDTMPLDAIEKLVGKMEETGADIVEGAYCEMYHKTLTVPRKPYHGGRSRYLRKLQCQNMVSHRVWGKIYRRAVIERVENLFIEGIDYCEDLCATLRLAAVTKRTCTNDVVYHYRTDNVSSYTKTFSESSMMSYFKAQHEILRFYHFLGHIAPAVEIGILNAYRECYRVGYDVEKAEEAIGYVPQNFSARCLAALLKRRGVTYIVGDILYRIVRGIVSGI